MSAENEACDVCGTRADPLVTRQHSRLGPFSFNCCTRCRLLRYEPYWGLLPYVAADGGLERYSEQYRAEIIRNVEAAGATEEEFRADVHETMVDMANFQRRVTLLSS